MPIELIAKLMGKRRWLPTREIVRLLAKRPEYSDVGAWPLMRAVRRAALPPVVHDGWFYYASLATQEVRNKWWRKEDNRFGHWARTRRLPP